MHPSQNDIILLILFTSLIFAVLAIFLVSLVNINARNNARRQKELMHTVIETQEKERQRIATDLHDDLGLQFSAIKLRVGCLNEPTEKSEDSVSVEHTQMMIDKAINDLRLIARDLMPHEMIDYGVGRQLRILEESLNKINNMHVNLSINNEEMRFPVMFELNLYRILQEMINNTLKYAGAKNIFIAIENTSHTLKIFYRDDGTGFDALTIKKGLGIKNIETRVQLYNGRVQLTSSHLAGTAYAINFDKKQIDAVHT